MSGALQWWETIGAASAQYNLDPRLVAGVVQTESSGNPRTTSGVGAMGLMQLMPATAKSLGVTNAYDPTQNIYGGAALLRENLDRYGDVNTALLAYHGGTNQANWGAKTKSYPGKVMKNINLLFGNSGPVVTPAAGIAPVSGAQEMTAVNISDYTAPDLTGLTMGAGSPDFTGGASGSWGEENIPWYRVDKHVANAAGSAYDAVTDAVSAPVEAAGNYALRGVVIIAAVAIVVVGLYFLFQDEINSAAMKMIPAGKAAGAAAKALA
ncbi:transclycosylase [Enterobacteria phage PRD1]|uniref:Transglycosylase n=2 Tax=Enterobacteria phage PRD1 TaxID=10658 RepID=EXLYS_BPPRD|nr:transglycosylase [Enterobacteria phage PRD1]P27380.3 RecName: Full=Transglycosylase; AltName: Full=Protein P7 [Enterobacteria phage PRD1]AAX45925.1 transclycosylase [Enterobacteria phage PRD1]